MNTEAPLNEAPLNTDIPPSFFRNDDEAPLDTERPEAEWSQPEPFTAYDLPPFPKEALPPALAGFVSEVSESVQVPYDMPALFGLGIVGAAGSRYCRVRVGQTHHETLNLYILAVGEPGERKSGMYPRMVEVLETDERERRKVAEPLILEAKAKQALYEKRIAHLRDTAVKAKTGYEAAKKALLEEDKGAEKVPPLPTRLVDDVTPEALADIVNDNEGTVAVASPEGGLFGMLAGRYSEGKVNIDLFLKGHSGEALKVNRKNGTSLYIPSVCLSVLLAVQPGVIASLSKTSEFRERGLVARFLYALPETWVGDRMYQNRPIDAALKDDYESAIKAILALAPPTENGPAGYLQRHELCLNGKALTLWAEYADRIEKRQATGGDLADFRDWASKLAGAVARIAGGFHLLENAAQGKPWAVPISVQNVERAWAIGEYLIPHAKAAVGLMGANPNVTLAQRLLRWIKRTGASSFTRTDAHRAHQNVAGVSSVKDMEPPLTLLCERGYLREKTVRPVTGRPSPGYEVNPACLHAAEDNKKPTSD